MALRQTVRFSIICHKKDAQKVLDFLANERIFHPATELGETEGRFVEEPSHLKQTMAKIEFCLDRLKPFLPKGTLLDAIEDRRPELKLEDVFKIVGELDVEKIYGEISSLSEEAEETKEAIQHVEREIERVSELKRLDLTKETLLNSNRKYFSVYLFKAPRKDYEEFLAGVGDLIYIYRFDDKNERSRHVIFLAVVHREREEELLKKASQSGFTLIEPPEKMTDRESFREYLDRLHLQKIKLTDNLKKIYGKISAHTSVYRDLLVAFELYQSELEKFEKSISFEKTQSAVLIDGWVPREQAKRLKNLLESNFICEVFIDSVADGKRKPVILENKGILKSMQFLTELYGNPRENEPDPTPLIAPYFLLFFGFCIGDAGYGLLLALIGIFLKIKFKLKDIVRSFADIFVYGGLGAVVIGVLSASYFSIDTKHLPSFLVSLKVFEPIESPVSIIVLSLVLGFMHILTGIILSAYVNFKENFKSLVFLAEIGKILLLTGAFLLAGLFLSGYKNDILQTFGKFSLASGAALIVLFSSSTKSFVKRVLSGFYSLYGMTSYLGDISSYARLMALMLAGVLIGMAVNMLSKLAVDLLGVYAGFPIAVMIAIFGHLFNLVMSIVSAFVHSLRLQFVEFFKQFYSDGGIKFNPIGIKERYIKIKAK